MEKIIDSADMVFQKVIQNCDIYDVEIHLLHKICSFNNGQNQKEMTQLFIIIFFYKMCEPTIYHFVFIYHQECKFMGLCCHCSLHILVSLHIYFCSSNVKICKNSHFMIYSYLLIFIAVIFGETKSWPLNSSYYRTVR